MLEVILLLTLSKPRITAMSATRDQDQTSHFRSTDAFSINALVFSIMKTHAFFSRRCFISDSKKNKISSLCAVYELLPMACRLRQDTPSYLLPTRNQFRLSPTDCEHPTQRAHRTQRARSATHRNVPVLPDSDGNISNGFWNFMELCSISFDES